MTKRVMLPGIEVGITDRKGFPRCRPEFRTFYRPGYTRITVRVLDSHIFARNHTRYFDFVRITERWNVEVAKYETAPIVWIKDDEEIVKIQHSYAQRDKKDYDLIRFFMQSEEDKLNRVVVTPIEHNQEMVVPVLQ